MKISAHDEHTFLLLVILMFVLINTISINGVWVFAAVFLTLLAAMVVFIVEITLKNWEDSAEEATDGV